MTAVSSPTADLLATIVAATRRIVEVREAREPLSAVARRAEHVDREPRRLLRVLSREDGVNVIAECKRRSPSRGVLRAAYDPVAIARGYAAAGAAAISVLTEPTFFDGALDHLQGVSAAVEAPVLRKDFILSEYQLVEAKAAGADAVLLIVAVLDRKQLAGLAATAAALGLDVLVEVHDEPELDAALAAGSRIIGVNNRNLRTLVVDVDASNRLVARIPRDVIAVSESGLRSADEITRLRRAGYRAFLIGERLMVEPEPGEALRELLRQAAMPSRTSDRTDAAGLRSKPERSRDG